MPARGWSPAVLDFLAEARSEGLPTDGPDSEVLISGWLRLTVAGSRCPCGAGPLRRFETFNGLCEACRLAELERRPRPEDPLVLAGVPPRYRGWGAAEWVGSIPGDLLSWAAGGEGFYVISGPVGTGKSHLAVIAFREWIRRGGSGTWRSARDLHVALGDDERAEGHPLWMRLERTRFLILDDFGSQPDVPWAADRIGRVIDSRYQSDLRTLVTTNLTPAELYGSEEVQRIGSRLLSGHVHIATGRDARLLPYPAPAGPGPKPTRDEER